MHFIGQNKHSNLTCNTLCILPVTMTCAKVCWQTTWGHIPQLFANFGPGKRHLRTVTSAKHSQELGFRCLHLIGWNKHSKLGAVFSIFSLWEWLVQSYAAILFRNTFLNFVSNFSLEGGNWVVCLRHQHFSKMGYFKCTILFNICIISFLSCYDIGCTGHL